MAKVRVSISCLVAIITFDVLGASAEDEVDAAPTQPLAPEVVPPRTGGKKLPAPPVQRLPLDPKGIKCLFDLCIYFLDFLIEPEQQRRPAPPPAGRPAALPVPVPARAPAAAAPVPAPEAAPAAAPPSARISLHRQFRA